MLRGVVLPSPLLFDQAVLVVDEARYTRDMLRKKLQRLSGAVPFQADDAAGAIEKLTDPSPARLRPI
eukprot:432544-Pleurochrysis_carterae.AAC.1